MRKQYQKGLASGAYVYQSTVNPLASEIRWLRAGFFSFAYRLAHLRLSRLVLTPMLATLFFLA